MDRGFGSADHISRSTHLMLRHGLLYLIAISLSACATTGRQTREILRQPPEDIPRAAHIKSISFINQTENFCGPSTLAMAMQWAGRTVTVDELASQVYAKGAK